MSIINDIKLYNVYKKTLKQNKESLLLKFNIRIDTADRMYTVLNLPDDLFDEPYNVRKEDIEIISEQYIKEYIKKLSEYLDSIGLRELYGYYDPKVEKVDKYAFLIVIGFKHFDSVEYNTILYRRLLPAGIITSIVGVLLLFLI